jgi:hypothetical protein
MDYPHCLRRLQFAALCSIALASGQVAQDHPELCGRPGVSIPLPTGVSIVTDLSEFRSALHSETLNKTIDFPPIMERVQQVCPIPHDEVVVFGLGTPALYNIEIVGLTDGSLLDSFYGYSPVIAPSLYWLARRKFYPAHAPSSEEYMIYDLTKDWAHNREPGVSKSDMDLAGKVMYPAVAGDRPFYSDNLPISETHRFRSDAFYWSPDGQALLFADSVQEQLSLVLVLLEHDEIKAYDYRLTNAEACPGGGVAWEPTLSNADISLATNGHREIQASFKAGNSPCEGTLTLQSGDFRPATPEVHAPPHVRASTRVDR